MKIAIYISKMQVPTAGGGYTFMSTFLNALINSKSRHQFYVFYQAECSLLFNDSERVKFIRLGSQETHKRVLFWKIRKKKGLLKHFLEKYNIDVLYTLCPEYIDVDCPTFITVWDYGHKDIPYFPEVSANGIFKNRELMYKHIISKASKVIVGNLDAKIKTCNYYGLSEDKVFINSLPTPDYIFNTEADDKIIKNLNLTKNEFIFYPAQFWAHKNHIRIIKSIKILKERGINLKAVFSGSDKGNLNYLKQKVKEFDLEKEIVFAGFITNEQIIALYKNTLALVYASFLGPDNLPPLEAMALDCPVIVSDISGHRIQLKDNCIFFNPLDEKELAEKIISIKNNGYSKDLIKSGKELALIYSTENYLKNTIEMFDNFEPILECWRHV